jgi:hypothetical protein
MVGMVLLIGIGLTLVCLLGVVMVSMTRHLLAHPDEPVHQHGDGGWSSTPDAPVPAPTQPSPALQAARPGPYDVPLDDMPAEVVAEIARRLRGPGS